MRKHARLSMSVLAMLTCTYSPCIDSLIAQEVDPKPVTTQEDLIAELGSLATNPEFNTQGEYVGTAGEKKFGAQVIARGNDKYDVVVLPGGLPGDGWNGKDKVKLQGITEDKSVKLTGDGWNGQIVDGLLKLKGTEELDLKKVQRRSPTAGAKPPAGAIVLFDGNNTDAWEGGKVVEGKFLDVGTRTRKKFRDFKLHLEFRTPFMPKATGQGRGNSGMYLLDQYECQILDSFGLNGENNECGGFYTIQKPNVNMCLPPMSWQTYDVDFTAAKFDESGKKIANAVVTIHQNGVLIHDKLELGKNTPGGGLNDESKPGSIYLQNHGDAVRFRNIWAIEQK